ncbi:MAG: glycosyltransferase family 87 protein [Nannocystaceae bacterium]
MFTALRRHPERWLFTGFIALLLAPVIAQGLDRPLASLLGGSPGGPAVTLAGLVVALAGWLAVAAREDTRPLVAGLVTLALALALALALGLGAPGLLALVAVAIAAVALSRWIPARLPPALDGIAGRRRALTFAYVLVAILSVVQVARVSVFMADPTRTDAQLVPGIEFLETHSCLTAYVRADELAHDRVDNLYLAERWPSPIRTGARPVTPFSPFDLDEYFYPPPFLLITEVLAPMRGDFLAQRAAWFGLNGLLLGWALGLGAWALGGARWHRPLLLAPLFFGSLPTLSLLQVGNAQAAVVVVTILAMFALEGGRPALGGLGLALATASKISPGIFGVVLLVQRRWRAAAWTAGFGLVLLGASILAYGLDPLESWARYALPRLSSGEAFSPMLHHPESVALNASPAGIPFKLALLGVDVGDPWPIARRINQLFTLLVVALAVVVGRRAASTDPGSRPWRALAWMSLLFLAALRSPFAPNYVIFAFVWALTFLSAEVDSRRGGVALLVAFAVLSILPPLPLPVLTVYLMVFQALLIAAALWLILRRPPSTSAG